MRGVFIHSSEAVPELLSTGHQQGFTIAEMGVKELLSEYNKQNMYEGGETSGDIRVVQYEEETIR